MEIHSLQLGSGDGWGDRISAVVGGKQVWIDILGSPVPLRRSYDPFLLAGFVGAMERGEDLSVAGDAPVSPMLLDNLKTAISIYARWWPELSVIRIHAPSVEVGESVWQGPVGCFFSGGADSLYSLIVNMDEISHLILCRGLDIPAKETERWQRTVDSVRAVGEAHGKDVVLVDTNAKETLQTPVQADNHGAVLVSTALGMGFEKLLVPASHAYDFFERWGSHPMLDSLYRNEVTEVVHDHPAPRTIKMEAIARTGIGLHTLRVCNVRAEFNCGSCEKCVRTRALLGLMDVQSDSLEALRDPKEIRMVRIYSDSQYSFWADNLEYARSVHRSDFVTEIEKVLRSYRIRKALRSLDQDVSGGLMHKIKSILSPA